MLLIFSFSSQPSLHASNNAVADFTVKKLSHFTEYLILSFLYCYSLKHTTKLRKINLFAYAFMFTVFYAISDEFHQGLVPGREPALRDVLIDSVGGLSGLIVFRNIDIVKTMN